MKTVGYRSVVLYLLLAVFLGGLGYLLFNLFLHGSQWAMQPYNGHIYAEDATVKLGEIKDRDGEILSASGEGSGRVYHGSEDVRKALLHTVGDPDGMISTSVEHTMSDRLTGYNLITGLNDTIFSQFGRNVDLTVDAGACAAAYNAMDGHNGGVILYNYETGDILCKISAPTFDPLAVPGDIEENDAYKGVYLDNTLSGSFTPGSIFKIVTAAAAMEKWPDSWSQRTYDCQGSTEIGGDMIDCLHGTAHGEQTLSEALGNSCNVYFAHLANDIGVEALQKKAEEMGFNREFKFDSIPISESEIRLSGCNPNQLGWAGVGQYTLLSSPYHMMLLMGAVANGGEYVEPRLTEGFDLLDSLKTGGSRRLCTATEAENLKVLLRSDVENYYGDWLFPEGMNVCAKTGTGEVGEGKAPNCWMIGFCDSSQYPYAFAVFVEEGAGGIETAGNVASAILYALAE